MVVKERDSGLWGLVPNCIQINYFSMPLLLQRTGTDEPYLPSPLCGMLQSSGAHVLALSPVKKSTEMDPVDSMAIAEEQVSVEDLCGSRSSDPAF